MSFRLLLPLLLAALPAAALASTPIDETRPLHADGKVEISNLKGSIQVRVWDKPEVHVGGSLGRGVDTFELRGDRNELEIIVRYPRMSNDSSDTTDLVIDVPTRSAERSVGKERVCRCRLRWAHHNEKKKKITRN